MTVSEQIIYVVDELCKRFGVVVDWTSENATPYMTTLCEKLVNYEIWTSITLMAVWLMLSMCSIMAIKKFKPMFKEGLKELHNEDWVVGTCFSCVVLAILYITTIGVVYAQIMDIIKCVTFPEMYVFEYIQSMIK